MMIAVVWRAAVYRKTRMLVRLRAGVLGGTASIIIHWNTSLGLLLCPIFRSSSAGCVPRKLGWYVSSKRRLPPPASQV